ncbi:MAG: glycosyltransferase family 4 protein [Candidatus Omnitrophota bacterium]|jgi:glycosyltransferase involved in cell wall biosynthesis
MHICVISPIALKDKLRWGGIHTHTQMLVDLLRKKGYKITLIAFDYQGSTYEEIIDGVRTVFIPASIRSKEEQSWFRNIYATFNKIHKEDPIDCIFSEGYAAGYSANRLQNNPGLPGLSFFTFVHNFHLTHFYNSWKEIDGVRSLLSYFLKTLPRTIFRMLRYEIPFTRNCQAVIPVSEVNANLLQKIYRIPRDKIKVIHNWVDTDKFAPSDSSRRAYREKFNILDDTIVFLLVSFIWRPKGIRVAIKAFDKLVTHLPNSLLIIAGKGPDEQFLYKFISQHESIKNKVRLIGHCSLYELPLLYNCADIFLMPTLLSEGQAYTLIEAMACGLPSIVSQRGGNIETIGKTGILVPAGDVKCLVEAMTGLAKNPDQRKEFSHKARERVMHYFSQEVAVQKISSLISEICSSS